ncbi:MAG: hypothetical protein P4M05_33540 [Bradyrhizobium sp.]|nr:hypothetical protein [Bradyrhizobium sp.]
MTNETNQARVVEILAAVKPLAGEFYRLTGKPLGVTGEVAEYVAAKELGLQLAPARTAGYDALRGTERIQIKGRAYGEKTKGQRMSRIKADAPCDTVLLVLLDSATLDAREMWEAPFPAVAKLLVLTQSKARERGSLAVAEFKSIARKVWPKKGT